ncbi:hypothetical protein IEQ34_010096 [Dendrobium chrysotoxum]|uniref:Uncharacterized protein n=1 Tax=Dendrobium chrysotoxum TaxID=161865 RepID=A0AAV7H0L2_DENCH|nr:hypothetical protein IEQ34_010096 [Dendrobium chrysotoxum]
MSDESIMEDGHRYVKVRSEPATSSSQLLQQEFAPDPAWIFDELPKATIVSVSRPDASDITPMLLSYTFEFQYKQLLSGRFIALSSSIGALMGVHKVEFRRYLVLKLVDFVLLLAYARCVMWGAKRSLHTFISPCPTLGQGEVLLVGWLFCEFKWVLLKKASQVVYLHFALKKRAFIEEFHERQEQSFGHLMVFNLFIKE